MAKVQKVGVHEVIRHSVGEGILNKRVCAFPRAMERLIFLSIAGVGSESSRCQ